MPVLILFYRCKLQVVDGNLVDGQFFSPVMSIVLFIKLLHCKHIVCNVYCNTYVYVCCRLKFGNLTDYLGFGDFSVQHMEEDLYIPGNILFSTSETLRTTNGTTATTLAGSKSNRSQIDFGDIYFNAFGTEAQFSRIDSFIQVNPRSVVIVDMFNNCLRLFDRVTTLVSDYAGKCAKGSYRDGTASVARFSTPRSIIRNQRDPQQLLLLDSSNVAVRTINVETQRVNTIFTSDNLTDSLQMRWEEGPEGDSLLLAGNHFIKRLTLPDLTLTRVSGGESEGHRDGPVETATYRYPLDLVTLHRNVHLYSDSGNDRIRLVDIENDNVITLCSRKRQERFLPTCKLRYFHSLLMTNGTLYIGMTWQGIKTLPSKLCAQHFFCNIFC